MLLYEMQVTKTAIYRIAPAKIPWGITGAKVKLSFSPEWEGLRKTVVFRAGRVVKDILDVEDVAVIPVECTQKTGELLEIGVYGTDAKNTVAIPTLWGPVGRIVVGTVPSGDTSTSPDLPVWAQLLDMVKELEEQGVTQNEVDQAVKDYFRENPITAQSLGAAPAGYGLGASGLYTNDLNNVTGCGFFAWSNTKDGPCANVPLNFDYGVGINLRRGDNPQYYTQIGFHPNMDVSARVGGIVLRHRNADGVWTPFEYINPPMLPGVEYRTTERSEGMPVYAKRITYTVAGAIDGTGTVDIEIPHEVSGLEKCVRVNATYGKYPLPQIPSNGTYLSVYYVGNTNITVRAIRKSIATDVSFVLDFYYTKTE